MKISACYIVKNEEKVIARSLESVKDSVDEIIIVDTGSEDRTIEIAREFGAQIFSSPWNNDFATPRNLAIDHATGDWIVFLDADEFFTEETRQNIPQAIKFAIEDRKDAILIPLFNIDVDDGNRIMDQILSLRIFRRLPNLRFKGRIHEQLTNLNKKKKLIDVAKISPEILAIFHTGYSRKINQQKADRNLRLLVDEMFQSDTPEELFPYLAETYSGLGDYEKAERFGLLDIAFGRRGSTLASKSYRVLIQMLVDRDDHFIDRYAVTKLAVKNFPEIPEFHADLGECYGALGQIEKCIESLEQCLKVWAKYDPNKYIEQSNFSNESAQFVRERIKFWKSKLQG
ncbi:MAG: glycosyltransferase family 2 protein [Selenomonadaceae bacterium]|nr:glycosyltransferase family 2 protein [Selenomonadaceae bacterium]